MPATSGYRRYNGQRLSYARYNIKDANTLAFSALYQSISLPGPGGVAATLGPSIDALGLACLMVGYHHQLNPATSTTIPHNQGGCTYTDM